MCGNPCWRAARKSTGGERVCSEIAVLGVSLASGSTDF